MKNEQLRKLIRAYLEKPDSISQNDLARRSDIAPSTLAQFLKGRDHKITSEQERKLIRLIAPWKTDPLAVAGSFVTRLLRQHFTESEIAAIGREMARMGNLSGAPLVNDYERP